MAAELDGTSFQIEDVVIHPDYNQKAYQDVAVIKLKPSESKDLCLP